MKKFIKKLSLRSVSSVLMCSLLAQNAFAVNEWIYKVRSGDTLTEVVEREYEKEDV